MEHNADAGLNVRLTNGCRFLKKAHRNRLGEKACRIKPHHGRTMARGDAINGIGTRCFLDRHEIRGRNGRNRPCGLNMQGVQVSSCC